MNFRTVKLDKQRWKLIIKFPLNDPVSNTIIRFSKDLSMVGDHWELPANKQNISYFKSLGFILSESLLNFDDSQVPKTSFKSDKITLPDNLVARKYQLDGVSFIDYKNGRALIADEMGLGKTIQAILWLMKHPELRPAVIVCPSFLKINWYREIKKWILGSNPEILEGKSPYKLSTNDIIIINYEIIADWVKYFNKVDIKALIFDEVQFIKNPKARRTIGSKRLAKHIDKIVGLTGTPIENAPIEIYNIIQIIDPTIFPNYYSYIHKYCGAKRNDYGGLTAKEATNSDELHYILKNTIMLRRLKSEVLKELPPKQIVQVPLSINNLKDYKKAELEFISFVKHRYTTKVNEDEIEKELRNFAKRNKIEIDEILSHDDKVYLAEQKIESNSNNPTFPKIKMLEKLAADGKMEEVLNWIETFLESGEKLVVFAINRFIIDKIAERFPDALTIVGGMGKLKKQKAIDDFQNNKNLKLLVANIEAGGIGLTLTAASNVAIIQFPWNPSKLNQAIDRVHRITQIKQVTVWLLAAHNTIENKILDVINKKEKMISQIINGKEFTDIKVMMELIESYKMIKF